MSCVKCDGLVLDYGKSIVDLSGLKVSLCYACKVSFMKWCKEKPDRFEGAAEFNQQEVERHAQARFSEVQRELAQIPDDTKDYGYDDPIKGPMSDPNSEYNRIDKTKVNITLSCPDHPDGPKRTNLGDVEL